MCIDYVYLYFFKSSFQMSFKSNLVVALLVLFILFYCLHRRGLWLFEKSRARNKTKPIMTSIGDKTSALP